MWVRVLVRIWSLDLGQGQGLGLELGCGSGFGFGFGDLVWVRVRAQMRTVVSNCLRTYICTHSDGRKAETSPHSLRGDYSGKDEGMCTSTLS